MEKLLPVISTAGDKMGQDLHCWSANCMQWKDAASYLKKAAACVKTSVYYELEREVRNYLTVQALRTQIQCVLCIVSTAYQSFLSSSPPAAFVGST